MNSQNVHALRDVSFLHVADTCDLTLNIFNHDDVNAHNRMYKAEDKHEQPAGAQRGERGVDLLLTALFVTHCNTQQAIILIYVTPSAEKKIGILSIL